MVIENCIKKIGFSIKNATLGTSEVVEDSINYFMHELQVMELEI